MNLGVYIDFDNLIGGFKANLGINEEKELNEFQKILIPIILKNFLQTIKIGDSVTNIFRERYKGNILFKKVFAEYHNIPLKNLLKPEPFVFLYNLGLTPINPFVVGSGTKNKNASDISLTLEVVNDLIIKQNPIDGVVIFSGDIDFYPLISWIREHTAKEVYLISFSDRLNRTYLRIFNHLSDIYHIMFAEIFLLFAIKEVVNPNSLRNELSNNNLILLAKYKTELIKWLGEITSKLADKKLPFWGEIKKLNPWFFETIQNKDLVSLFNFLKQFEPIKEDPCLDFKKKLISGLKNWLKKKEKASTGLIIKNWLPNWGLSLSESEANECLKQLIESGELEKEGFIFHGDIKDGIPIGEFRNL